MKKALTITAIAMALLAASACNKQEKPKEEEKIISVNNYVIVKGDADLLKFYDVVLNYKCGDVEKSMVLKAENMTCTYPGAGSKEDVIIGLGTRGAAGKYRIIAASADWTVPYELSVSIDASLKDISEFPAAGEYTIDSNITGLYVEGITNYGFAGEGTIWYPSRHTNVSTTINLKDDEQSRKNVHSDLEHFTDNFSHSTKGATITVSGKTLTGRNL